MSLSLKNHRIHRLECIQLSYKSCRSNFVSMSVSYFEFPNMTFFIEVNCTNFTSCALVFTWTIILGG